MDNGAGAGSGTNNLASHSSSLASDPQVNESAPELISSFRIRRFNRLNSYWATITLMIIYVIFLALILPLHWYCSTLKYCEQSAFSIAAYSNVGVWVLTVAVTFLVHLEFEKVRRQGYARFYKKCHSFVREPVVVFSIGNAVLLVYTWILSDTKALMMEVEDAWKQLPSYVLVNNDFDKTAYFVGFQIVILLEVIVSFVFLIILTAKIFKFNSLAQPPDAINDGIMPRSAEPRSVVGYSESASNQDMVVDRQNDDINFLKARCRLLYGSVRKLLASLPPDERKRHEEMLKRYLEEHRNDDDDDADDINEYLSTGYLPVSTEDDIPLIAA